jgi:hypothetical protein
MMEGYSGGVALPAIFEGLNETPLARSPIVTVIWQLRFEEHPILIEVFSARVSPAFLA